MLSPTACAALTTTSGTGDYLVVTANADTIDTDVGQVTLTARVGVESRVRGDERRHLAPAGVARTSPGLTRRALVVGQQAQFRVPLATASNLCTSFVTVTATVEAVGTHGIILQDNATPPGFTATDFANLSTEFDNIVYPADTVHFGGPSDIDHNGHVLILFTPQINMLSSGDGDNGFTGGFFFAGDLFPRGQPGDTTGTTCYESNQAEIFYLLTPDASGRFGLMHSPAEVYLLSRGTLAHEFQHMINAGNRLFKSGATNFEQVWLDEGLAHVAEEFVGRAAIGATDLRLLTYADITANPNDFSSFFFQNLTRYQLWLQNPSSAGVVDTAVASSLAGRGASWSLLRHTADQFALGDVAGFTRAVAFGPDTGTQNIDEHINQSWSTVLQTWALATYVGGPATGIDSVNTFASWDMRAVETAFSNGAFPLAVAAYPPIPPSLTLPSGSARSFTLHVPPGTTHAIRATGAMGAQLYILRLD